MQTILANWKTSLLGLGALLTGAVTIISQVQAGHLDPAALTSVITSVLAGFGLVAAKDG